MTFMCSPFWEKHCVLFLIWTGEYNPMTSHFKMAMIHLLITPKKNWLIFFKKEAGTKLFHKVKQLSEAHVYMQKSPVSKGNLLLNIFLAVTSKTV